jgi:hypothetical protein
MLLRKRVCFHPPPVCALSETEGIRRVVPVIEIAQDLTVVLVNWRLHDN